MKTAIVVLVLAMIGCASLPQGVAMTDDERAACAASKDCTVWTVEELKSVAVDFFKRGFQAGQKRKGELSL